MRWLRRWFGYDEEPLEEIVGGLNDLDAQMWAETLRNEGIVAVVKSSSPFLGAFAVRHPGDYALHVRVSDAARARRVLAPVLRQHVPLSRRRFRLRRKRGSYDQEL